MRRALAASAALVLTAPAAAGARPSYRPSDPPPECAGTAFADQIGTDAADVLRAPGRAERLWGLAGDDRLTGSPTRATCLFGGRDDDALDLAAGGGIAWGEDGDDTLAGSALADTLDGGDGIDEIAAGPGDDNVRALDGRAEVVDCGTGHDLVKADRADLLIGCEVAVREGRPLPSLTPDPRAATRSGIVRIGYRVPEAARAGAYRVILTTGGVREITRFPAPGRRVRAHQLVRVGLRPPAGGWRKGIERAAIVLHRRTTPEPVARLRFSAG